MYHEKGLLIFQISKTDFVYYIRNSKKNHYNIGLQKNKTSEKTNQKYHKWLYYHV